MHIRPARWVSLCDHLAPLVHSQYVLLGSSIVHDLFDLRFKITYEPEEALRLEKLLCRTSKSNFASKVLP